MKLIGVGWKKRKEEETAIVSGRGLRVFPNNRLLAMAIVMVKYRLIGGGGSGAGWGVGWRQGARLALSQ